MRNFVANYFLLTVVLLLVICVAITGLVPNQVQARVLMSDGGDSSGDPNDEQDFNGGSGDGGYDDDIRDDYWGTSNQIFELPIFSLDGQMVLLVTNYYSPLPSVQIIVIKKSLSLQGDINDR